MLHLHALGAYVYIYIRSKIEREREMCVFVYLQRVFRVFSDKGAGLLLPLDGDHLTMSWSGVNFCARLFPNDVIAWIRFDF